MNYKLFDEYITLQALLKDTGVIHSGGAIKRFLAEHQVLLNGQVEDRRGKKLRVNDKVTIPHLDLCITLTQPDDDEITQHQQDLAEKQRVNELVKSMNKQKKTDNPTKTKAPVRFPGI